MENIAERISDSELEVMKVLWEAGDALPVTAIREKLHVSKGWEATTVKTLITRLLHKGAVLQEKRNVFYYSPLISEKEYKYWATGSFVSSMFNGSAKNLIAALLDSDRLTREDIEELRSMFRVEDD